MVIEEAKNKVGKMMEDANGPFDGVFREADDLRCDEGILKFLLDVQRADPFTITVPGGQALSVSLKVVNLWPCSEVVR